MTYLYVLICLTHEIDIIVMAVFQLRKLKHKDICPRSHSFPEQTVSRVHNLKL